MTISVELLTSVYGSVVLPHSAVYCSAPITSGKRFVRWVRSRGGDILDVDHAARDFPEDHAKNVVTPNVQHARAVIARLRERVNVPVIDPTAVPHIPTWRQTDWLTLWEVVIARFSVATVFIDEWQFSYGCAHEFAFATQLGLPTFSESGAPLRARSGLDLISEAVREIDEIGGSTTRLSTALTALAALPDVIPRKFAIDSLEQFGVGC